MQFSFVVPFTQLTLHVSSYGICFSLAFVTAIWLAHIRAASAGLDPERLGDLYVIVIVSALVGARTLFVWLEWPRFSSHPAEALRFWRGGLVFFGGLIGAVLASLWYVYIADLDVRRVADLAAPSLALGQAVGRLGCFANGCCYGSPCELPWALPAGTDGVLRHPTQLYESAGLIVITGVLLLTARRTRLAGLLAAGYLLMGALLRFTVEGLRGDDRGGTFVGGLSISQLISVGTFSLGVVLAAWCVRIRPAAGS